MIVFRDAATTASGEIRFTRFGTNKRFVMIFSNIANNHRCYQLMFFTTHGYLATDAELQTMLDNFVALIHGAVKYSCTLPNLGMLGYYADSTQSSWQSYDQINGNSDYQYTAVWLSQLLVFTDMQSYSLPVSRVTKLTSRPSHLGPRGKYQEVYDFNNNLQLLFILDGVSWVSFQYTFMYGNVWT
jgi:hypothetical protein